MTVGFVEGHGRWALAALDAPPTEADLLYGPLAAPLEYGICSCHACCVCDGEYIDNEEV